MRYWLPAVALAAALTAAGADRKLSAVIIDGVNNHDWAAGTRAIQSILEESGRFTVEVSTFPKLPDFSRYDVVINNFNGGHTATGTRWPAAAERALEAYVRGGGGLVVFHAANNAFLEWPAYNEMIGLGWRDKSFGKGLAVRDGQVVTIPQGEGLAPGHGPRHDFDVFTLAKDHPITRGMPDHWRHRSEQLTHGQHGPAEGLTILTYAFSEVSHQGEPMDWVRRFGKGRVYTTMLGHTWKDELNPNLDDIYFQASAGARRGVGRHRRGHPARRPGLEAAVRRQDTGGVGTARQLPVERAARRVLLGQRTRGTVDKLTANPASTAQDYRAWMGRQAWLYTQSRVRPVRPSRGILPSGRRQ